MNKFFILITIIFVWWLLNNKNLRPISFNKITLPKNVSKIIKKTTDIQVVKIPVIKKEIKSITYLDPTEEIKISELSDISVKTENNEITEVSFRFLDQFFSEKNIINNQFIINEDTTNRSYIISLERSADNGIIINLKANDKSNLTFERINLYPEELIKQMPINDLVAFRDSENNSYDVSDSDYDSFSKKIIKKERIKMDMINTVFNNEVEQETINEKF